MRTIIFGAGTDCAQLLGRRLPGEKVIGLIDNDPAKHGSMLHGIRVYGANALHELEWDRIRIASSETAAIRQQLRSLAISDEKIVCPLLDPENRRKLESWRGLHVGQTAVIVGNGPSLRLTDLDALAAADVVTFAFNKIYLAYGRTEFRPTYYMVEDFLVAENNAAEINRLRGCPKVMRDTLLRWLRPDDDTVLFGMTIAEPREGRIEFSEDPLSFYWGASVTYTALQLAFYMGCSTIYLTGVDFNFTVPVDDASPVYRAGFEQNHFVPEYRQPGERWNRPRPEVTQFAFEAARTLAEATGREIFNATRGGVLEVFPRVGFDLVFPAVQSSQ